jgi:DNA-directed RNA polymerase subunit K/omega
VYQIVFKRQAMLVLIVAKGANQIHQGMPQKGVPPTRSVKPLGTVPREMLVKIEQQLGQAQ